MITKAETNIHVSITAHAREELSDVLSMLLADTYILYLKTQNFHWNVKGHQFFELHKLFEEQYRELAGAVDLIAERIRALGFFAPATFTDFLRLSSLHEGNARASEDQMIEVLMLDHERITQSARAALPKAEKLHDNATVDLFSDRMATHEKAAWMLRSLMEE